MRKGLAIVALTAVLATPLAPKNAPIGATLDKGTSTTQGIGQWLCDWLPQLCTSR